MQISTTDITLFWNWFIQNSDHRHSDSYDSLSLAHLDQTITDWGLTWEIGPGKQKPYSLTISPNGNRALSHTTKYIVGQAPELKDWEFFFFKQAKENWSVAKFDGSEIAIDASEWTYVLLGHPGNEVELLLKASNLVQFPSGQQNLVIDLVLTNLLGEENLIEKITFSELVNDFSEKERKGEPLLKHLPAHLSKLLRTA